MGYVVGTTVELPVEFRVTATGALADPTTVTLKTVAPDGTITTYTYASANVVKDAIGIYRGIFTPNDDGEWRYEWIGTGAVAVIVNGSIYVTPSATTAEPVVTTTYATVQELRDEIVLTDDQLTDQEAKRIILDAEDYIDDELGLWTPNETTGRKIVQADVEAWQWAKLRRATVKLAAALHGNPKLTAQRFRRQKGPDFEVDGPMGSPLPTTVISLLDQSGLRRLTTSLDGRANRPPWYSFSYNDTSWDYDPPPIFR